MKKLCAVALLFVSLSAFAGEQQLATYPKAVHTRIGNDLVINGQYYRMAYFTTTDSISTVARYFLDTWNKEGYPTRVDGDQVNESVVSAFYTREGLMRSVVLRTHQDKTLGFTVLQDMWLQAPEKAPPAMVQLEGTLFSNDLSSRDALSGSVQRTAVVEADLQAARKEAISKYEAQGFELRRETGKVVDAKQQYILEFSRNKEDIVVHVGDLGDGMVNVNTTAAVTSAQDNAPTAAMKDAMRTPKTSKKGTKVPTLEKIP